MGRLAVNGHEGIGLHDGQHELQLLGGGMTGNVNERTTLVVNVGTDLGKLIDDARNRLLVAGDGRGRDDDRVALLNRDGAMVAVGDARQGRQGLALGAGAHQNVAVVGQILKVVRIDEVLVGDMKIP